jgi:hypothetical protein
MRNWLFGLQGRIIYDQFPWCQRKWWTCSWLCSSPVSPSSVSVNLDFSIGRIVALSQGHNRKSSSPHQLCLGTRRLHSRRSEETPRRRWHAAASGLSRNRIRSDARLQIKGCKKISISASLRKKFVHWLPRYDSAISYRCIALLQLLHRYGSASSGNYGYHHNCCDHSHLLDVIVAKSWLGSVEEPHTVTFPQNVYGDNAMIRSS